MSYFACLLSVISFFVVFVSDNFDVTFISDIFCGEISLVIYNVWKLHFCKCHSWYKRNLLTLFYLCFIIVFDHQTVSATATAVSQSSVSALVSATAVTKYSVLAHFRLRPKPENVVSVGLYW